MVLSGVIWIRSSVSNLHQLPLLSLPCDLSFHTDYLNKKPKIYPLNANLMIMNKEYQSHKRELIIPERLNKNVLNPNENYKTPEEYIKRLNLLQ